MNEQTTILFFLIIFGSFTIFLYLWKAKKELEYQNDERWQVIQNKANGVANYSHYILILLLAIGSTISLFSDIQITFTFNRILTYSCIYIGFRNMMELLGLKYFDKEF